MKIDYGFILSAGKGLRMGEIGKVLPKVLWPIFNSTLLECQIHYLKQFDVRNIYANLHFGAKIIDSFLTNSGLSSQINLLFEENLLDIGGAIHNLAAREEINYKGILLAVNCDQFLFYDFKILEFALPLLKEYSVVMFANEVPSDQNYGQILVDEESCLKKINRDRTLIKEKTHLTYSGVALINLNLIDRIEGKSDFFESVANFKKKKIKVINLKNYEYWDFGTILRYKKSIYDLLALAVKLKKSEFLEQVMFLNFCVKYNTLLLENVNENCDSYGLTDNKNTINLSNKYIKHKSDCEIILFSEIQNKIDLPGIYYKNLFCAFEVK